MVQCATKHAFVMRWKISILMLIFNERKIVCLIFFFFLFFSSSFSFEIQWITFLHESHITNDVTLLNLTLHSPLSYDTTENQFYWFNILEIISTLKLAQSERASFFHWILLHWLEKWWRIKLLTMADLNTLGMYDLVGQKSL